MLLFSDQTQALLSKCKKLYQSFTDSEEDFTLGTSFTNTFYVLEKSSHIFDLSQQMDFAQVSSD